MVFAEIRRTDEKTKASIRVSKTVLIAINVFFWYLFTTFSNIYSKKFLDAGGSALTLTQYSFGFGMVWWLILYGTKKLGKRTILSGSRQSFRSFTCIAILHIGNTLLTNLSYGESDVKFTYTVKSAEPLVTALFFFILFQQSIPFKLVVTLIPVPIGVLMATITDISITAMAFTIALLSVVVSAARTVVFKRQNQETQIGSIEQFLKVSSYAFIWMYIFLWLEPVGIENRSNQELKKVTSIIYEKLFVSINPATLYTQFNYNLPEKVQYLLLGSSCHFFFNLFSFKVLGLVNPLTHSLGNVVKRLLTIVYTMIYFKMKLIPLNLFGIVLANFGVFWYITEKAKQNGESEALSSVIKKRRRSNSKSTSSTSSSSSSLSSATSTTKFNKRILTILVSLILVITVRNPQVGSLHTRCIEKPRSRLRHDILDMISTQNVILVTLQELDKQASDFVYEEEFEYLLRDNGYNILKTCQSGVSCNQDEIVAIVDLNKQVTVVVLESRFGNSDTIGQSLLKKLPKGVFVFVIIDHGKNNIGYSYEQAIKKHKSSVKFIATSVNSLAMVNLGFSTFQSLLVEYPIVGTSIQCMKESSNELLIITSEIDTRLFNEPKSDFDSYPGILDKEMKQLLDEEGINYKTYYWNALLYDIHKQQKSKLDTIIDEIMCNAKVIITDDEKVGLYGQLLEKRVIFVDSGVSIPTNTKNDSKESAIISGKKAKEAYYYSKSEMRRCLEDSTMLYCSGIDIRQRDSIFSSAIKHLDR